MRISRGKKYSLLILPFMVVLLYIHPFLCLNHPIDSEILVVEGWMPIPFMEMAIREFAENNYKVMLLLEFPQQDKLKAKTDKDEMEYINWIKSFSPGGSFQFFFIPATNKHTHRTYNSYVDLNNWIKTSNLKIHNFNIFTASVHARKSYIISRKIISKDIDIGIISSPALYYNPNFWWLSHRGIYLVFRNAFAFIFELARTYVFVS